MRAIYSADEGLRQLAAAQENVESAEMALAEAQRTVEIARNALTKRREEFDRIRTKTLEFCPALETGYAGTSLTETVGIVDGKVTIVPLQQASRPSASTSDATSDE